MPGDNNARRTPMLLIETFKSQAAESYWRRPGTQTQLKNGAAAFFAFLILLKMFS